MFCKCSTTLILVKDTWKHLKFPDTVRNSDGTETELSGLSFRRHARINVWRRDARSGRPFGSFSRLDPGSVELSHSDHQALGHLASQRLSSPNAEFRAGGHIKESRGCSKLLPLKPQCDFSLLCHYRVLYEAWWWKTIFSINPLNSVSTAPISSRMDDCSALLLRTSQPSLSGLQLVQMLLLDC